MKLFLRILRTKFLVIILFVGLLCCAFYTHPHYVRQLGAEWVPDWISVENDYKEPEPCSESKETAPQLNDRYRDYIWNSAYQKFGEPLKTKNEIRPLYLEQKLMLIESTPHYEVDTLYHSYAFLTPEAKHLLDEISWSFQHRLRNTTLRGTRLLITSLLRTLKSVRKLSRVNRNALRISSHLHGTTFDLAHNEFVSRDSLQRHELDYLREVLAQTLDYYRQQKRCFVTYETRQACFHVVSRRD